MQVLEIAPGLWRWTGLHPDWTPEEGGPDGWEQEVGCLYYEAPENVVLIDPLVPPEDPERFWTALDRDVERAGGRVAVAVTCRWHMRSTTEIAERYGAATWRHGSSEPPPASVEPHWVGREDEVVLWLPEHRAVVAGDVLLGAEQGGVRMCPESWIPGLGHDGLRAALRPLLDLPVERVLVSHGEPVLEGGRDALSAALAA